MMILSIAVYLGCSFVGWSLTLGHFTHKFPYMVNTGIATFIALLGPIGIIVALVAGQPFHWRVVPLSSQKRWEIFNRQYSALGRDYFEENHN